MISRGAEQQTYSLGWSERDQSKLDMLIELGATEGEMARMLGRSIEGVKARLRQMKAAEAAHAAQEAKAAAQRRKYMPKAFELPKDMTTEWLLDLPPCPTHALIRQRAASNVAFLISMLRAGHTPGQGELHIEPDLTISAIRPPRPDPRSWAGSPAAMCGE